MPFDAELTVNVNERFMRVRNLIAELPPERFNYARSWPNEDHFGEAFPVHECKSNLCILGWARVLYGYIGREEAWTGMGLTEEQGYDLFFSGEEHPPSRDQAIRTMDHLAATGIVDWTV